MRLLLCLRYGAGRYIMIKANFQALRLCALIIPAEIRVCIIAAKTRANIDHLYAALPPAIRSHQFPDKAPSRMAEAQKPSCSKRKTAKQRSSEHRTLCNIFSPYHSSVWGQISIGEITDSPSRYPMRHILFLFKKTAAK